MDEKGYDFKVKTVMQKDWDRLVGKLTFCKSYIQASKPLGWVDALKLLVGEKKAMELYEIEKKKSEGVEQDEIQSNVETEVQETN